jgi:hypothetical protein
MRRIKCFDYTMRGAAGLMSVDTAGAFAKAHIDGADLKSG